MDTYTQSQGDPTFLRLLDELFPVIEQEIAALRALHLSKGADYADASDPLRNYAQAAADNGLPAWRAAQTRLSEKYHRLTNLTKPDSPIPQFESVADTYRDLAALALITLALRTRLALDD